MRAIFNEGLYWPRVQIGELDAVAIHWGTPDPESGQEPGTRTVMIAIRDKTGADLVHAHGFIEPGWMIGASGKLDPKRIWKDGKLYRLKREVQSIRLSLSVESTLPE
jgi:hypothetical protein